MGTNRNSAPWHDFATYGSINCCIQNTFYVASDRHYVACKHTSTSTASCMPCILFSLHIHHPKHKKSAFCLLGLCVGAPHAHALCHSWLHCGAQNLRGMLFFFNTLITRLSSFQPRLGTCATQGTARCAARCVKSRIFCTCFPR